MAESLPGTLAVFSAAYQNMLAAQGKGGGLTGAAAQSALYAAVEAGKVKPGEIMKFVQEEMQRRAAPKLEVAKQTSQAWQDRLANQRTGWTKIASEAGVEEGQRNFFRFFTQWMNQNKDIPEKFGQFWEKFSEQFVIAGGFPDLIRMTLEGQETIIKEWLGSERTERMIKNFESLSEKAGKAAEFLGLFRTPEEEKRGKWEALTSLGADAIAFTDALTSLNMTYDEGIGVTGIRLSKNIVRTLADNTPLGAISRRMYGFAVNPERDDEGRALAYLSMTGQQPVYHPRGLELLTAGQGGQQSGGDTIVLNIPGVTLMTNTNSREETQETLAEFFEDMLNRAMPAKN